MSETTLIVTQPTVLDANGNGVITLKPASGQFWAPLFVRVSTNLQSVPVPYCSVSHGTPGVPALPSQFIDDTYLGSGDTSSMIAGTPVYPGEAIIFTFKGGTPGDTAVASVYGMTSDVPPNLGLFPQVPGAHFSGKPITELTTVASSIPSTSPLLLTHANPGVTDTLKTQIFDVRQWTSYYSRTFFQVPVGTGTGYCPCSITLQWFNDSAGTTLVYEDFYEVWADTNNPPTVNFVTGGPVHIQDVHHGPYLQVTYLAGNPDSVNLSYTLNFTTRQEPTPRVMQRWAIDGSMSSSVGSLTVLAGTTLQLPQPLSPGRVWQRLGVGGSSGFNINFFMGSLGIIDALGFAANTRDVREVILPKRPYKIDVVNTSGVNNTISVSLFPQFEHFV